MRVKVYKLHQMYIHTKNAVFSCLAGASTCFRTQSKSMISSKSHKTLSFSQYLVPAIFVLLVLPLGKHFPVKNGICRSSGGSGHSSTKHIKIAILMIMSVLRVCVDYVNPNHWLMNTKPLSISA